MPRNLTKILSLFLSFCLILEQSVFAQTIDLSHYFARNSAQIIPQSDKFRPLHLRYISYDNQANDFKILLDKGDAVGNGFKPFPTLEDETKELMKYFFIGLALPNEKFWVNLRPDSPDNILDPDLEKTDIGRILLEADLQLKKDTSGMTSPQTKEGREYWDKLYKKSGELFGSQNITIPAITRPWIVPNEIIIRESAEGAYIYKATLKVMLEEDYLRGTRINSGFNDSRLKELNEYSTQLIKESIIPKLTYEVNASKRYAPLRQVYYSLILAQWFKQKYGSPESARVPGISASVNSYIDLIDSKNLAKIASSQPYDKQSYFQQYQKSFKDGEYNLQEPVYTPMGQSIRRYVSGGTFLGKTMSSPVIVYSKEPLADEKNYLLRGVSSPMSNTLRLFLKMFQPKDLDPGVKDLLGRFGGITSNMIKDAFLTRTDNVEQATSLLVLLKNIKYKFEGDNLSHEQRINEHLLINVLYNLSQEMDPNLFRNGISDGYIEGLRLLEKNLRDPTYREAFISLFNQVDISRVSSLSVQSADLPKAGFYPMESHKIIHHGDMERIFNMPTDIVILENAMQDGVKLLKTILAAVEEVGVETVSVMMPKIFEKKFPPNKLLSEVITYNSAMEGHFELTLRRRDGRGKLVKCYFGSGNLTHLSERGVISLGNVGLDIGLLEKLPIGSVVIGPRYNSDRAVLSLCGFIQMHGREGYYIKKVSYSQEEMEFLKSAASLNICFVPVFDSGSDLRKIEGRVKELVGRTVEAAGKASSAILNPAQIKFMQLVGPGAKKKEILIVCFGNLNRSPAIEVFLKEEIAKTALKDITVKSAGTRFWEINNNKDRIVDVLWEKAEGVRYGREEKLIKAIALGDPAVLELEGPLPEENKLGKKDIENFYFNFNFELWKTIINKLKRNESVKLNYQIILGEVLKLLLDKLDEGIKKIQLYDRNERLEAYVKEKIGDKQLPGLKFGKVITRSDVVNASIIIAADNSTKENIKELFPGIEGKVVLFNELAPNAFPGKKNVPDPQTGEISMPDMLDGVEKGVKDIVNILSENERREKEYYELRNALEFIKGNSGELNRIAREINYGKQELTDAQKHLLMSLYDGLKKPKPDFSWHTFLGNDKTFRWRAGDILMYEPNAGNYGIGSSKRNFWIVLEDRLNPDTKEVKALMLGNEPNKLLVENMVTLKVLGNNEGCYSVLMWRGVDDALKENFFHSSSSLQTQTQKDDKDLGGIALNFLPIQVQAGSGVSSVLTSAIKPLSGSEMEAEWVQIQAMVNSAIRPSPERLERYAVSASSSLDYPQARDRFIGLFADILRNDETNQRQLLLEPALKNILLVLENNT